MPRPLKNQTTAANAQIFGLPAPEDWCPDQQIAQRTAIDSRDCAEEDKRDDVLPSFTSYDRSAKREEGDAGIIEGNAQPDLHR
jgi:hypothetical protein